jgi:RHS repeat-associated protein
MSKELPGLLFLLARCTRRKTLRRIWVPQVPVFAPRDFDTDVFYVNAPPILDFAYNFSVGTANNGNVTAITNNRDTTRSQNFNYDSLNRLFQAYTTYTHATSPAHCWGEQFGYDPWGNLLNITASSTAYTGCTQEAPSNTVNTKNQLVGYCYDAAGNQILNTTCPTGTFTPAYTYNAENQLTATAGMTYLYDGDGKRVEKATTGPPLAPTKLYWYGTNSDALDETDANGSLTTTAFNEYIFFNGQRIARRDSSNNVDYYFSDHLGTARIVANSSGTILDDSDFYPFGGERPVSSSSGNTYKFTAKERDSESGLDNFGARYSSSATGRFMSPDPLAGHTEDPQTLNRYPYVRNNPLNLTDPTGLDFHLSCQTQGDKCQKDAAGNLVVGTTTTATDADGNTTSTFTATVVTSASLQDASSGNTAVVNENGVEITTATGTAQGIFINGTPAANIQGDPKAAGWSDFVFNINSSDEKKGTLTQGSATYKWSRDQADVIAALNTMGAFSYVAEQLLGNYHHPGELNFRFSSGAHPNLFDYGPSPHFTLPQDPKATVPVGPGYDTGFHVDSHTGPRHSACAEKGIGCTN